MTNEQDIDLTSQSNSMNSIPKTYKNYINGEFSRTESGRYYSVKLQDGKHVANVGLSTRKDIRNAVRAARKADSFWANKTAYNRGQIIYRIAEILSGRREQFTNEMVLLGYSREAAENEINACIELIVYFAGWTDKIAQVFGSVNPVASKHFNFSRQEPIGVVGIICPETPSLLGMLGLLLPNMVAGNSQVIIASKHYPLPTCTFAEVLATSDVPAGIVNIITGSKSDLIPAISKHMDVNLIVGDTSLDTDFRIMCELESASNMKRVYFWKSFISLDELNSRPDKTIANCLNSLKDPYHILYVQEVKTTWHPVSE